MAFGLLLFSPHVILSIVSALIIFFAGQKVYRSYQKNKNARVLDLAIVYFAMACSMLFLLIPALLRKPALLPFTLSITALSSFTALAFYFRILFHLLPLPANFRPFILPSLFGFGILVGILTFLFPPKMEIDPYGWVSYQLPLPLKIMYGLFTVIATSFVSSSVFLMEGIRTRDSRIRRKAIALGGALFLIGIGVLLGIFGEKIFFNFFFLGAFILFYLSVIIKANETNP